MPLFFSHMLHGCQLCIPSTGWGPSLPWLHHFLFLFSLLIILYLVVLPVFLQITLNPSGIRPGTNKYIINDENSLSETSELLYSSHPFVSVCYIRLTLLGGGRQTLNKQRKTIVTGGISAREDISRKTGKESSVFTGRCRQGL